MSYWRMQLHPMEPKVALRYTVTCLAAKLIGLDFGEYPGATRPGDDVGDLLRADPASLPKSQRGFLAFATDMREDDYVLVMAHNFPFALCRVAGPYQYVREIPRPEPQIWFHHFRRVEDVRYYGDFVTDAHAWQRVPTPQTLGRVSSKDGPVFQFIRGWLGAAQ